MSDEIIEEDRGHQIILDLIRKTEIEKTAIRVEGLNEVATATGQIATSFGRLSSAARFAGNSGVQALDDIAKSAQIAFSSVNGVLRGISAIQTGAAKGGFLGGVGVLSGGIGIGIAALSVVQALSGRDDAAAEKRAAAARRRSFGTTIQRGPTTYNIFPTLSVDSGGGDVYFGVDGPEVLQENIKEMMQKAFDDGAIAA